jgi:hypothetical protein
MSEVSAAVTPTRGTVGNTRSIGLSILWAILTLGIYCLFWVFKTQEETKQYSGEGVGGWLGLVIYLVIGPVTPFLVASEVGKLYSRDGQQPPVTGITGLWLLLPIVGAFVWFIKVQGALNTFWMQKGAPAV